MRETEYVVYRVGSNAANQSMTQTMPIGVYTGRGKRAVDRLNDAYDQARAEHAVYANQFLDAIPLARVKAEDTDAAYEYQALREQQLWEER